MNDQKIYRPKWCLDEWHTHHARVDSHTCKRCGRPLGWALDLCWDCYELVRTGGGINNSPKERLS